MRSSGIPKIQFNGVGHELRDAPINPSSPKMPPKNLRRDPARKAETL
jgi:hypothetical protein